MDDAEKAAYSRGYNAGRKRKAVDISHEARRREERAFLDRAFLAALSGFIQSDSVWSQGDRKFTSIPDRVALAWMAANDALKHRGFR